MINSSSWTLTFYKEDQHDDVGMMVRMMTLMTDDMVTLMTLLIGPLS